MRTERGTRGVLVAGTVLGGIFSVVLAVVMMYTSSVANQLALLIGLTGVLLSALVSTAVTLAERLDSIETSRIEAAELRALASMPQAEKQIVEITKCLSVVRNLDDQYAQFFWDSAIGALQRTHLRVTSYAGTSVPCTTQDEIYYVRRALALTRDRVSAIAARGPEWWLQPEADVYWQAYRDAASRLAITRIFLVHEPLQPEMTDVLERHSKLGMKTFTAPLKSVPMGLRTPIVIFDEGLLHRTSVHFDGVGHRVEFTADEQAITTAKADFHTIAKLPGTKQWEQRGTGAYPNPRGR